MATKTKKEENDRPLILNLIVIIGYALLAFIMWPDIKGQICNMRNYGVEGYTFYADGELMAAKEDQYFAAEHDFSEVVHGGV
ncbi:unnamed protein product [Dovyalis caffra]|uniref:Uncharacterized protein n=1 Tax=Dovyalis caffra TaxID=77055 RepID=A0AAV1R8S1_9ROSI|nr:unnamed protein product [Dovyalis caffra]